MQFSLASVNPDYAHSPLSVNVRRIGQNCASWNTQSELGLTHRVPHGALQSMFFFFHKNVFIFTRAKHFAGKKGLLVVYNHTSSMHQYSVLLTLQARALGLGKEDYATSNEDWIDASENLVFLW